MILLFHIVQMLIFFFINLPNIELKSVEIEVQDLKNNKGQVCILVFTQKDGYPEDFNKAIKKFIIPIQGTTVTLNISDLNEDNYVFTVLHDENKNNLMDKNLFGIPKEGYGVSNNPDPTTFGPPEFQKGMVKIENNQKIKIRVRY